LCKTACLIFILFILFSKNKIKLKVEADNIECRKGFLCHEQMGAYENANSIDEIPHVPKEAKNPFERSLCIIQKTFVKRFVC